MGIQEIFAFLKKLGIEVKVEDNQLSFEDVYNGCDMVPTSAKKANLSSINNFKPLTIDRFQAENIISLVSPFSSIAFRLDNPLVDKKTDTQQLIIDRIMYIDVVGEYNSDQYSVTFDVSNRGYVTLTVYTEYSDGSKTKISIQEDEFIEFKSGDKYNVFDREFNKGNELTAMEMISIFDSNKLIRDLVSYYSILYPQLAKTVEAFDIKKAAISRQ